MASCDRDRLMRDIRSGIRLKPTKTNDRSKPIVRVDGEQLKKIRHEQAKEESGQSAAALPPPPPVVFGSNGVLANPPPPLLLDAANGWSGAPPPPPPPPPPVIQSKCNGFATLPKMSKCDKNEDAKLSTTTDRDALMQAIRQGVTLRKVAIPEKRTEDTRRVETVGPESHLLNGCRTGEIKQAEKVVIPKSVARQPNDSAVMNQNVSLAPTSGKRAVVAKAAVSGNGQSHEDACRKQHVTVLASEKSIQSVPVDIAQRQNRPQKLPLNSVPNADPAPVKIESMNAADQKVEFALNGYVSEAKAIWEKRSSQEDTRSSTTVPQAQPAAKSAASPTAIRAFEGPDQPDSVPAALQPAHPTRPAAAPLPQANPIAVDTNCPPCDFRMRKSSPAQAEDTLPKVDALRRAYEPNGNGQMSNTVGKYQRLAPVAPATKPAPEPMAIRSRSYDSLDNEDSSSTDDCSNSNTPSLVNVPQTTRPSRFLPDVGALKQRFEERAIEERHQTIKSIGPGQQRAPAISTSNVSSGYSSGSPSPKSSENGKCNTSTIARFQYSNAHLSNTANENRQTRSASRIDYSKSNASKSIDISKNSDRIGQDVAQASTKGSFVASNPNSDLVGPFKASFATLGGDEGKVIKNRNYYQKDPSSTNATDQPNGNANDKATWIVKKGSIPNIVTKYSVCEHLETLHQKKLKPAASSDANSENANGANLKCDDHMDGEVARLLGIPFEKLKELRFEIDVNDPEGSLLRIQKRYNEVS